MSIPNDLAAQPLSEFEKLARNVYLYTPAQTRQEEPEMLIILCSWMGAAPKHIAKYIRGHQQLFPHARILLLTNFLQDFFLSQDEYDRRLLPAVSVVQAHCNRTLFSTPNILIHSFSNGGARQLTQLSLLFRAREGVAIPARAVVLDSSPGRASYWRSYAAIVLSFPRNLVFRLIGPPLLHCFLITYGIIHTLMWKEDAITVIRRKLNDERLFAEKAPRLYLYSKADIMVGYEDVEDHGDEAVRKGMAVKRVRFINSPHAGHIMEDDATYWNAINEVWTR